MKIKLLEYQAQNPVYVNNYNDNYEIDGDLEENEQKIRTERYQLNVHNKWFDGIHISTTNILTHYPIDFYYESLHHHIGFLFCLNGNITYFNQTKAKRLLTLNDNQQTISIGHFNRSVFHVNGQACYTYIQLTASYFKKVANLCLEEQYELLKNEIPADIALLLRALQSQMYVGRTKRIFLESKIFELIIYHLKKKEATIVSVKEEDVRKILLAKQLIDNDLQRPCSLMELARKAGINDYKLKKGFKAVIGHTVFGYLYKIRMERAYYFLLHEKKTVNEVAFLVGYKNAQHFISAFKKQYNLLPGSLNKN